MSDKKNPFKEADDTPDDPSVGELGAYLQYRVLGEGIVRWGNHDPITQLRLTNHARGAVGLFNPLSLWKSCCSKW